MLRRINITHDIKSTHAKHSHTHYTRLKGAKETHYKNYLTKYVHNYASFLLQLYKQQRKQHEVGSAGVGREQQYSLHILIINLCE